jgi:hypothetical protein
MTSCPPLSLHWLAGWLAHMTSCPPLSPHWLPAAVQQDNWLLVVVLANGRPRTAGSGAANKIISIEVGHMTLAVLDAVWKVSSIDHRV